MKKLAGMRVTAGLSQTDVANALGISQGAVSKWERGDGNPTLDKIKLLAELYEVTTEVIIEACAFNTCTNILVGKEV